MYLLCMIKAKQKDGYEFHVPNSCKCILQSTGTPCGQNLMIRDTYPATSYI